MEQRRIFAIAAFAILLLASGCTQPQDQGASNSTDNRSWQNATVKPVQNATPPSGTGKCGDGVCDQVEKTKGVCPQDCKANSTPTPSNASSSGPKTVGFIGCSLTLGAVSGYQNAGGTKLWLDTDVGDAYPGGSVKAWYEGLAGSSQKDRWAKFEEMLSRYGNTTRIWWNMCSGLDNNLTYAQVLEMADRIRKGTNATIYISVSPKRDYVCQLEEQDGPDKLDPLAAELISSGWAQQGPALTPLSQDETGDNCHPNTAGQAIWGKNLADFFGK